MKEVTLKIPDNKLAFFMELTKQLGLEAFIGDEEITDAQKELVRSRVREATEKPERLLAWDEVRDSFKLES